MATYRPSRRDDFHVAVICALPLEYDAAVLACDEIWGGLEDDLGKAAQDPNTYTLGRIGKHNVVLVLLSGMGKVNAASATSSLRSSYRELRLALLCGICGGVPSTDGTNEVLLGDVIISNSVVQYDLGRQYPDQFAPKDTIGDSLGRPTKEIRSLLIGFETHRKRQELQRQVSQNLAEVQRKAVKDGYDVDYSQPRAEDVLFQPDYLHRHRKQQQCGCSETHICDTAARTPCVELKCDVGHQVHRKRLQSQGEQQAPVKSQRPRVFVGQIGSGDTVMKSGQHRDSIAREHSLVAFEMEGAGVWDEMPCIIVKGVCDYADSHKNKDWQHYAAATAASATKALLGQFASTSTFDARVVENKIREVSQPKFIVPYVENPDFVGRDIILDRIKQQFGHAQSQNEATLKPRTRLALQGLGGVGKTQIALAYVYWLREAYPELSVLWVHASNHQRFRQAFTAIAQECNIPGHNDASADILSLVKEWLENKQSGRWLLVIDNADDKDLFLPPNAEENDVGADAQSMTSQGGLGRYVPDCAHGSVLITTRNKQAGLGLTRGHSPIEVKKMTDPEAHQLLCSLLGNDDISPKDTVLLAYRLEYLPLALAQAASFILMNSLSIDEYVQLLDKSDSSFVRQLSTYFETVGRDSDTPHALTATWTISFNQIEQRHPLASKILSLISIFDRQAIPGEFVRNYCYEQYRKISDLNAGSDDASDATSDIATSTIPEDDSEVVEEVTTALGTLQAFSFISKAAEDTYDMHRLVQLVTHKWLLRKEMMAGFAREALKIVARAYPYGRHEDRELCLKYLPHALAVIGRSGADSKEEQAEAAGLEHNVAAYFFYRGQYLDAELHQKRALHLVKAVHGQEHAETFSNINLLVRIYEAQKRLVEAEKLLLPTLEMEKRLMGEDNNVTLATTHHLASVYHAQGRLEEAEKICLCLLEKGGSNEEDRGLLDSTHLLAHVYFDQERLEEAERLYLKILEIDKRVLGAAHPDMLSTMGSLAEVYETQGRLQQAEELLLEVIEGRRRTVGEENSNTLFHMYRLARVYEKKGWWEQAGQLNLDVLEARRRTLGEEHPDTLESMAGLAGVYNHEGQTDEALELYTRLLELRRKALGETHPLTLIEESTVARFWWAQGRQKDAIRLMRRCVHSRQRVIGRDHPRTVSSFEALSRWMQEAEESQDSYSERDSGEDTDELEKHTEEGMGSDMGAKSEDDSDEDHETVADTDQSSEEGAQEESNKPKENTGVGIGDIADGGSEGEADEDVSVKKASEGKAWVAGAGPRLLPTLTQSPSRFAGRLGLGLSLSSRPKPKDGPNV